MQIQRQECHFSMPFLWLWGNVHENGKLHGSLVVEGIMGASRKFNMTPWEVTFPTEKDRLPTKNVSEAMLQLRGW